MFLPIGIGRRLTAPLPSTPRSMGPYYAVRLIRQNQTQENKDPSDRITRLPYRLFLITATQSSFVKGHQLLRFSVVPIYSFCLCSCRGLGNIGCPLRFPQLLTITRIALKRWLNESNIIAIVIMRCNHGMCD